MHGAIGMSFRIPEKSTESLQHFEPNVMEVNGSDVPLQFGDIFRLQPLIFKGGSSVQNKEIKQIHFLQLRQKQKEKEERQREENRKKDT